MRSNGTLAWGENVEFEIWNAEWGLFGENVEFEIWNAEWGPNPAAAHREIIPHFAFPISNSPKKG